MWAVGVRTVGCHGIGLLTVAGSVVVMLGAPLLLSMYPPPHYAAAMFTAGLLALNRDVLYQIKRKALYQSSPWAAGLLLCCVAVERAVVWADPLGRNTGAWARVLFPFLYYGLWPAVSVTLGLELGTTLVTYTARRPAW